MNPINQHWIMSSTNSRLNPPSSIRVGDNDDNDNNDNIDDDDSIDNYTNRSPYPTFHVLREAEVEKAVDVLEGNAETVWKRNVDLLEAMEDLFDENQNDDNDDNQNQNHNHAKQQQEQQSSSMTLLRSVFLKGKANRRLEQDEQNRNDSSRKASSSSSSCPVPTVETIQAFQKQIKGLLKEFRKKDY
mmetsp:Transcript_6322/g.15357  ORF Transcript_6322/g.15357 Transcript_6322/m.15357 type:complete len:187 (+) Transcript_6322:87-647(+)